MNAIAVRTHQGEYYAGETVYGMIYLKVATPDFQAKVQLLISGIEHCEYTPVEGDDWSINHPEDCLRNPYEDRVMSNPVEIFTQKEPLPIGNYKFPFYYKLKPGLPSSTFISSPRDNWQGSVIYKVIASASSELIDTQSFVCLGKRREDIVIIGYSHDTMIKACFCYERGRITLSAELDKTVYRTGETMKLTVNVNNKSSELTKAVKCSLRRTVKLHGCWVPQNHPPKAAESSLIYESFRSVGRMRTQEEVEINAEEVKLNILGKASPKENRTWVIDMPLATDDGALLPPTTMGTYLKVVYSILIQVAVPRATDLLITVPIFQVLSSASSEWLEWRPEAWMQECEMPPRQDKLAVKKSILESPVYEGLL
ncbi:uncharacterized protein LOC117292740 [Asterias rubens]|uniref:uncharacterized protein LOC117292740 n=1 Tax=Asterias rubens TaxID=7604 RepID=UPI001455AC33|nr:uncharacterized protein LOC117292740 [Asterias rubens]